MLQGGATTLPPLRGLLAVAAAAASCEQQRSLTRGAEATQQNVQLQPRPAHLLQLPRAAVGRRQAPEVARGSASLRSHHARNIVKLYRPRHEPPATAAAGGKWVVRQLHALRLAGITDWSGCTQQRIDSSVARCACCTMLPPPPQRRQQEGWPQERARNSSATAEHAAFSLSCY